MPPPAITCFMQPPASLSCHTVTASLLRQVTQASQAPPAAPNTLQAERDGKKKTSYCKGKEPPAAAQVASHQTHAQLMSQMRQADEPLNVGGKLFLHAASWSVQTSCIHVACLAVSLCLLNCMVVVQHISASMTSCILVGVQAPSHCAYGMAK